MSAQQWTEPRPFNLKTLSRLLAGSVIGALVGFGCVSLALKLDIPVKSLTWADFLALWMSIAYLGLGLVSAFVSTNRRRLAQTMEGEEAELPATNDEVRTFRMQAAVLALTGVMLLAPVLSLGRIAAHPGFAAPLYTAILVLFVLQTALNVRLWRSSDEFGQRTMLIVAASTFAVGQGIIFLWAAAERIGLAPVLTGWQAINLLMTCYLAIGFYVSMALRRRS
jgi:hypothetical protein